MRETAERNALTCVLQAASPGAENCDMANRFKARRLVVGVAALAAATGFVWLALLGCTAGPARVEPQVETITSAAVPQRPAPALKVMSLNLAHGRSNGRHQLLQSRKSIQGNLDAVAKLLARERAYVVALQEADGPSIWSGRFNHVDYLASKSGYPFAIRAENVKGLKLSYGAAMLSMLPMQSPQAFTFKPSPLTPTKGFVVATVRFPTAPPFSATVVSVHLDFLRQKTRRKQVAELAAALEQHKTPLVVMGDFNCEWTDEDSPVQALAKRLNLHTFEPHAEGVITFPKRQKRLDWILVSPGLEFVNQTVLPDVVSDHRAVVAELRVARPRWPRGGDRGSNH